MTRGASSIPISSVTSGSGPERCVFFAISWSLFFPSMSPLIEPLIDERNWHDLPDCNRDHFVTKLFALDTQSLVELCWFFRVMDWKKWDVEYRFYLPKTTIFLGLKFHLLSLLQTWPFRSFFQESSMVLEWRNILIVMFIKESGRDLRGLPGFPRSHYHDHQRVLKDDRGFLEAHWPSFYPKSILNTQFKNIYKQSWLEYHWQWSQSSRLLPYSFFCLREIYCTDFLWQ